MSDYLLCKKAGLKITKQATYRYSPMAERGDGPEYSGDIDVIQAKDVEAFLANAPAVDVYAWPYGDKTYWRTPNLSDNEGTHQARLVMIEPIVKDTAESLLRELIELRFEDQADLSLLRIKAKQLLEGK